MEFNISSISSDWEVQSELGAGTFSLVVQAKHRASGRIAALKYGKSDKGQSLIKREIDVLRQLQKCKNVPRLLEERSDSYVAMEVVGRTLESLRREMQFSDLTIAMLGEQLVAAFEALHAAEFIHRDVKTDNLAISLRNGDPTIYLIDFGAASRFTTNGFHIRYEEDAAFVGNQTFCSLNVLRGMRPSRRDDMESIGYVLLYLFGQRLPWVKINSTDIDIQARHIRRKLETTTFTLCRGLEPEYQQYLDYCRSLRFDERPDYSYIRSLFRNLAVRLGFCGNWEYDWNQARKASHSAMSRQEKSRLRRGSLDTAMIKMVSNADQGTCGGSPERKNRNSDQESITSFLGRCRTRKEMCVIVANVPDEEQPVTPLVKPNMNIDYVRKRLRQTEVPA